MPETETSGRFLVMALDLDDSVQVFGTYPSPDLAKAALKYAVDGVIISVLDSRLQHGRC